MKSTLYLKFIILYVIFGFLSLFTVSALSSPLISGYMDEQYVASLYQEANLIANDYLTNYFDGSINITEIYTQLRGMSSHLDATIWFVDHDGEMIASAKTDDVAYIPALIENFDPAENGGSTYQIGTYHNYFSEEMVTVIAPVTRNFSIKGYLLIHKSCHRLRDAKYIVIRNTAIIAFSIYLLSFLLFLGIHFLIYRPAGKDYRSRQAVCIRQSRCRNSGYNTG